MKKDTFKIPKTDTFDLQQTLDCGQVFRFCENEGKINMFAGQHFAKVELLNGEYVFECDDAEFFQKYLDFDTNYDIIQLKAHDKGLVSSAIESGKGIHILKQDALETIFSFIISQNNHIPRIKSIIERICFSLGVDMGGYYAFPTLEAMANADASLFYSLGAGYRAEYLSRTARQLVDVNLDEWRALETAELRNKLISLHGVGRKVADCVLLFGFQRYDVFPVDTWILKVFAQQHPNLPADKLSQTLVEKYGDIAGFVQQWLFYYKRKEKKV